LGKGKSYPRLWGIFPDVLPQFLKNNLLFTVHPNGKNFVENILPLMAKETVPDGNIVTSFKQTTVELFGNSNSLHQIWAN